MKQELNEWNCMYYGSYMFFVLERGISMKKLACLHAHHSNIEYIDRALQSFGIEILHFVDPILSRILKEIEI